MNKKQPKLNRRHYGVMNWMFEHPSATLTECAKATGYSRSWLSQIVNSDEFKETYEKILREAGQEIVRKRLGLGIRKIL